MITAIVVMGPSGNGKSTLAAALAKQLGWRFIEGDDHHPPANIAKMACGEPLSDADREPFLRSIGAALAGGKAVAACSALRRSYRALLGEVGGGAVLFVVPQVAEAELARRMASRPDHFMPPSLIASQLATLELPGPGERALLVDGTLPLADLVAAVMLALHKL